MPRAVRATGANRRRRQQGHCGRSAAPGLACANSYTPCVTPHSTHLPTTHLRRGQEFEEWEAGEVGGGEEKGLNLVVAAAEAGPKVPIGE